MNTATITPESEQKRVIAKLRALETERAPSLILDKCDAKILLAYIHDLVQGCKSSDYYHEMEKNGLYLP